jgi:hypothetical protein
MAEPLNATFFAFKKREKGGVLIGATAAFVAIAAALIGAFFYLNAASFGQVFTWYGDMVQAGLGGDTGKIGNATPPTAMLSLIPSYLLLLFAIFILYAAWEAACLRWMIRGESGGGFLGLTLGSDTWRVWATYWVFLGLFIAFEIALLIVIGIAAFSVRAAGGDGGGGAVGLFVIPLILAVAVIYLVVRLSPAAAASIARQRFSFFSAWAISRGRFWALFGAYVLLALMGVIATFLLEIAGFAAMMGAAGPAMSDMAGATDPQLAVQTMMTAMTQPSTLIAGCIVLLAFLVMQAVFRVAFFGVTARAAQAALEEGKITPATS